MKREILSIAFVAISSIMITAVAKENKEMETPDGENKGKCVCHKGKRGMHREMPPFNPFEGIELSDAQKEQLKSMTKNCKADVAEKGEGVERRDNPRDMRKKHLEDMQQILTPSQYVQYLENIALNQPMMHKWGKRRHHHPGFRPHGEITPSQEQ